MPSATPTTGVMYVTVEARGMRPTWTEPNLLAVTLNLGGSKDPLLAEYTMLNAHDKRSVIFDGIVLP